MRLTDPETATTTWQSLPSLARVFDELAALQEGPVEPIDGWLADGTGLVTGVDHSRWRVVYLDGRPDGQVIPFDVAEGREIVVNKNIIVPPFGTTQRKYAGVLGTNRLNLGDGYALHGTDVPSSIGTSVSHGCVRLRNEDIETLYQMVPVGTPVYIY